MNLPIHIALTLTSFIDVLAAFLIYKTCFLVTGNWKAGILASMVYLLNPFVLWGAASGLEISVNVLSWSVLIFAYFRLLKRDSSNILNFCLLGGAGALAMLARTDNVLLFVVILGHLLLIRRSRIGLLQCLVTGGTASVLVFPWLLWNLLTFGSVTQVSAVALPYMIHYSFGIEHGTSLLLTMSESVRTAAETLLKMVPSVSGLDRLVFVVVGFAGALALAPGKQEYQSRFRRAFVWLLIPALTMLVITLLHTTVRWFPRLWYFAPVALLTALLIGIVFDYIENRFASARRRLLSANGLLLLATIVYLVPASIQGFFLWEPGRAWQSANYESAIWLEANMAPSVRIGSFNAGIISYYSGTTVINLDGSVNNEVLPYIKRQALLEYIDEMNIRYLVDWESAIMDKYACFMEDGYRERLKLIQSFSPSIDYEPGSAFGQPVSVYEVLP